MKRLKSACRYSLGIAVLGIAALSASAALSVELTVWAWDPNFNGAAMAEAGSRYAALHPDVTVEVVEFGQNDLMQKLQTQLASGVTEGLPDILLIGDYSAQKYLQAFPGAFAPLSETIDFSAFAPYKVALGSVDGVTYALPFDSGVTGLFYRRDYLEQAGYGAEDLADITWDELIEIGRAVEQTTGHKLLSLNYSDPGIFGIMLQSTGQWYFDENGESNFAENATLKTVFETFARILQSGIYKPVSGWSEYTGAFTSGEVAGVVSGVWMSGTIKANADQAGLWGVAPIPKVDGVEGATHASNLGGSSWYVPAAAPNKDVAIDFLNTVWAQDADFYQSLLMDIGAVGSLLAARDGAAYQEPDAFFGGQAIWADFATWLGQIPGVDLGLYSSEVYAAIIGQVPALLDGGSVDNAIAAIDSQVRQLTQ